MRNALPLLALTALAPLFGTGCAGPEQKLGNGLSNTFEIVRMGEMRRSIEQSEIFDANNGGFTKGLVTGFDRSMVRTGVGLYEVVTFPIPSYDPPLANYLNPGPGLPSSGPNFPSSYTPGRMSNPLFDTDTYTGFSGGDVVPFVPGSRFNVLDN